MADQHGCVTAQVTSTLPSCSAGIHRHTPHTIRAASPTLIAAAAAAQRPSDPPPVHPRDRPSGVRNVRGHFARPAWPACSLKFSVSTMQLDGASGLRAVRDSANASRNWLQRERRTMMASASLGGGALALRARGRFCMLPEPRGSPLLSNMGRDSSSHLSQSSGQLDGGVQPDPPRSRPLR